MNRVIARKVVPTYHQIFKLSRKQFCSDEAAKSSAAAASSQFNQQESDANLSLTGNVQPYDIAIVGGGMVGMALACSLATTPLTKHLRVAIIDSSPALANKPCIKREDPPDPRVSTVTPATISFFKDTGAWQYVQQHRHAYFDKMQVWDYTSLGYTKYDARDVDKEVLGCVVENKVLHSSLLSRIEVFLTPNCLSSYITGNLNLLMLYAIPNGNFKFFDDIRYLLDRFYYHYVDSNQNLYGPIVYFIF